jgi:hypothetical protein
MAKPLLKRQSVAASSGPRFWATYHCSACGGAILAMSQVDGGEMLECWPPAITIAAQVPERARVYLHQARETLAWPEGALVLCAAGVDLMLKQKGFKDGGLKARIDQAAKEHFITADMAKWAHQVRLDANEHRNADENDARRCLNFALALAEALYVLPARVTHGIEETKEKVS